MLMPRQHWLLFGSALVLYMVLVLFVHFQLRLFDTDIGAGSEDYIVATDDDVQIIGLNPGIRRCMRPRVSGMERETSKFRALGDHWIFSAYFDDRLRRPPVNGSAFVRVLALLRERLQFVPHLRERPPIHIGWSNADGNLTLFPAELYEITENHDRLYGGWILSAAYDDDALLPPCSVVVSLTSDGDQIVDDRVRVPLFRTGKSGRGAHDGVHLWSAGNSWLRRDVGGVHATGALLKEPSGVFAVCVPPLYGNSLTVGTVVQFVELTRLLGAQHFVIYVVSAGELGVSESVIRALDVYKANGVASTIVWTLPFEAGNIWNNGQVLAANDCLYRTAHAFRYVAFIDVDEYIVPHSAVDWSLMLAHLWSLDATTTSAHSTATSPSWWQWLERRFWHRISERDDYFSVMPSTVCGYTFRSAYFPASKPPTEPLFSPASEEEIPSSDISATLRSDFSSLRNKVLVRPDAVFEVGIHHVSRPLYTIPAAVIPAAAAAAAVPLPTKVRAVPPNIGFLHHYRQCTVDFERRRWRICNRSTFIRDTRLPDLGLFPELALRLRRMFDTLRPYSQLHHRESRRSLLS